MKKKPYKRSSTSTWSVMRLIKALGYSWSGFQAAFINEAAFRQELLLCIVLAPIGLMFGDSSLEKVMLLGSLFVILIVELINTAIEAVVDRIGPEDHPMSGLAKDLGSAAVFLSLCNGAITWILILFV